MESPEIALIDCGAGNLGSVKRALEFSSANVKLVQTPEEVAVADAIVFPGQGAFASAMEGLRTTGFDAFLKDWISNNKPFMGICLGLQLLFEHSEEGDVEGLGIFKGDVKRFPEGLGLKIPHMGWNTISIEKENAGALAEGLSLEGDFFYFVHSYYVETPEKSIVWSSSEYGVPFVSGIHKGNTFAVQFHPEKSLQKGLLVYKNFLNSIGKPD